MTISEPESVSIDDACPSFFGSVAVDMGEGSLGFGGLGFRVDGVDGIYWVYEVDQKIRESLLST